MNIYTITSSSVLWECGKVGDFSIFPQNIEKKNLFDCIQKCSHKIFGFCLIIKKHDIGSAITSLVTGLFKLVWWQWPLLFVGIILVISGPSMFIAWLKLRRRNLGPILDANGWAVNTRAKINIKFGTSLTGLAKIPEGSEKSLADPYADKKRPWGVYILVILIIIAIIVLWKTGYLIRFIRP